MLDFLKIQCCLYVQGVGEDGAAAVTADRAAGSHVRRVNKISAGSVFGEAEFFLHKPYRYTRTRTYTYIIFVYCTGMGACSMRRLQRGPCIFVLP